MKIPNSLTSLLAFACLFGVAGCKQKTESTTPIPTITADDDAHDHSVAGHGHGMGPHEGTIADWGGGKYHVEFTVDHDKAQATVYVLGSDEKTATPIDAKTIELSILEPEMFVKLQAVPQENDPEGKASRFVGTDEQLGIVQEYEGTMTGVIDGTPYSGDFKEEAHAHD